VSKFQELAQAGVSANGKLLYFYFAMGPFSSFAGIGRVSVDTTASDTGLSRAEIETALAELQKRPTPSRSFIVCDRERNIVWVRDYLKDDPAREKDPDIRNETHRKGIENTLGDLPRDSPAVRKFRSYYHFTRHTPTGGPAGGTGGPAEVPTTYFLLPTNNKQLPTSDRERETNDGASPTARLGGAPSTPSTHGATHDACKGNDKLEHCPTQAEMDHRRLAIRAALKRSQPTLSAAVLQDLESRTDREHNAYYRTHGRYPALPDEPPSHP
jgi:hypothetical protein